MMNNASFANATLRASGDGHKCWPLVGGEAKPPRWAII